jgi:hypothetical protein
MNKLHPEYTKEKVLKNVKYTAIWAIIILITIVLPTEYGIDPLGFWKMTWLNKLAPNYQEENLESNIDIEEKVVEANSIQVEEIISIKKEKSYDYQTIEKTYTLNAKANTEIKFKMYKWSEMTFDWESSELVYFDQHWEPTTQEWKEFLPYKTVKEWKQMSDNWNLVAEFTWTHGWYWRNLSNNKATIKLILKGNFEEK